MSAYREQAIMKRAEIVPEYVAARYRRLNIVDDGIYNYLIFQYRFDYQWFWRTKRLKLGVHDSMYSPIPSNDALEKVVRDWLDLRARSGAI